MDEQQLVERCLANDPLAQRTLYERYASRLMGICCRYVSSRAEANDVLQESFLKIFEKMDSLQEIGALESWMRRITVTTALNYLKKHRKHQLTEEISESLQIGVNENAHANLGVEELMQMVMELPLTYRTVFNMYAIDQYPHKEISRQLGITESTSRAHYSRARAILMQRIKKIENKDAAYLERWG